MEAVCHYSEAKEVYSSMLERNPANSFAMKREVCVLLAKGMLEEGGKSLNRYLQTYQGDIVAWQQMAELQIELNNRGAASFSYEELLLSEPTNFLYHNSYAELLYSLGGCDNFRLARRYFAQSLELNRTNNARAAFGLVMATFALAANYRAGGAAQADKTMTPREEREDMQASSPVGAFLHTACHDSNHLLLSYIIFVSQALNMQLQQAGGSRLQSIYGERKLRMHALLHSFLTRIQFVSGAL